MQASSEPMQNPVCFEVISLNQLSDRRDRQLIAKAMASLLERVKQPNRQQICEFLTLNSEISLAIPEDQRSLEGRVCLFVRTDGPIVGILPHELIRLGRKGRRKPGKK